MFEAAEVVDVVIRPEDLDVVPREQGMLKGVVKNQIFKGVHYDTIVETRLGASITVKMHVSEDSPVVSGDEKISANSFYLDTEDVDELTDQKLRDLAQAEAWNRDTETPVSIKDVISDIRKFVGKYHVTFRTAMGAEITVEANVVEANFVESPAFKEKIYAMNFFVKTDDIKDSLALDTDLKTWANASAWSLEDDTEVAISDVNYDFDWENIEPGEYDVTFATKGYRYKVSTTKSLPEGTEVGLIFDPEDIHLMKKEVIPG